MRTTLYRSKLIIDVYECWIRERSRVLDVGCVTAVVSSQVEPNFTTFILDVLTNFLRYGHFGLPWCARKAVYWSEYFKGLDLDSQFSKFQTNQFGTLALRLRSVPILSVIEGLEFRIWDLFRISALRLRSVPMVSVVEPSDFEFRICPRLNRNDERWLS